MRRTPSGDIKVLDFGLAKPVTPRDHGEPPDTFTTQEGRVLGTPTYMAPEQARGAPLDRRVDVWAFGCVLYECLSGRRAFRGDTASDVLAAVQGFANFVFMVDPEKGGPLRDQVAALLRRYRRPSGAGAPPSSGGAR